MSDLRSPSAKAARRELIFACTFTDSTAAKRPRNLRGKAEKCLFFIKKYAQKECVQQKATKKQREQQLLLRRPAAARPC